MYIPALSPKTQLCKRQPYVLSEQSYSLEDSVRIACSVLQRCTKEHLSRCRTRAVLAQAVSLDPTGEMPLRAMRGFPHTYVDFSPVILCTIAGEPTHNNYLFECDTLDHECGFRINLQCGNHLVTTGGLVYLRAWRCCMASHEIGTAAGLTPHSN